jgi:addiction module HigA family antidote
MSNLGDPFIPVHPGGLIKKELACRKISQRQFAQKIGFSYTVLNEILNEKHPVSVDFALALEAALGLKADMLIRMQTDYDIQVARHDSNRISHFRELHKKAISFL